MIKTIISVEINQNGYEYSVNNTDFESAPDPICCELVTTADLVKIALNLEKFIAENYNEDTDKERFNEEIWGEYEQELIKCKTFYYEDCTHEEMEILNNRTHTESETLAIYNRINNR